jgi:type VI protein secretion system component VasF
MSLIATNNYLADLVSDLSEALRVFSNEAAKLSVLLARSEAPVSPESYSELRKQCVAEVQSFEEYLNRKEEIFAYLNVESRHP